MVPILSLIFVVALSMFINKAATIALMHTGMTRDRARFQARSAFSGAGFTTSESEVVVKHPVRRKIIMLLILMGNAGVVTAISSLILGFVNPASSAVQTRNVVLLVAGISLLVLITRWSWFDRWLEKAINWWLRRYTEIRAGDLSRIMTVMDDFEICELSVEENAWLKGNRLDRLRLTDEGLLVLGILRHDRTYIGVPRGRYTIEEGDKLFIYGKADRVESLSGRHDRLAGKEEHQESVASHREEMREQDEVVKEAEEEGDPRPGEGDKA